MVQIRDVEGGDKLLQRRPFICTRGAADVVLVLFKINVSSRKIYNSFRSKIFP
jgi:hypothetical protein